MLKLLFRLFFVILSFVYINSSFAQITLTVSSNTPGTCPSTGVVVLNASGGLAPYQYRIISGPIGMSYPTIWQSSSTFNSLLPGSYNFEAMDASSPTYSKTVAQTVTSSYSVMSNITSSQSASYLGSCATRNVKVNLKNGVGLFTFELLQGGVPMYAISNIPKAPTTSATFNNVISGTYTFRATDGCGEIRTLSPNIVVTSTDFKWNGITGNPSVSDNSVTDKNGPKNPLPFNQATISAMQRSDPYLFTCDSIAFVLSAGLTPTPPTTLQRRFYVRNLNTNTIDFDITYNTVAGYPSIQLAINTPYRFYFDDLCNDLDSLDRNYNYSTGANFIFGPSVTRFGCSGYSIALGKNNNWNTKNRFATAIDTLTITSSSLVGDTMVGKRIIYNWTDQSKNVTNIASDIFRFYGITPGTTYSVRIQNGCHDYTLTTKLNVAGAFYIAHTPGYGVACLLNTSNSSLRSLNLPMNLNGYVKYYINSGPSSFTDNKGYTTFITYPIIDSVQILNGATVGTAGNDFLLFRNFPVGTYTAYGINQCGQTSATISFTIKDADLLKFNATINEKSVCGNNNFSVALNIGTAKNYSAGITFSREYWNGSSWILQVDKKSISTFFALPVNSMVAENTTYYHTFSGTTGKYRFSIFPANFDDVSGQYRKGPVAYCDTLWSQVIDLVGYKNPEISSLSSGYVCTSGGNDGIVDLISKNGVPSFVYDQLDNSNHIIISQNNGHFIGLSQGTYKFRVVDNCGNGVVQSIEVKEIQNPTIQKIGLFCNQENTIVTSTHVTNNAVLSWSGPNGFSSTADTLKFTPLIAGDAGAYVLTQTIPGCPDPKTIPFNITVCSPLPIEFLNFSASCENGVTLKWSTATENNVNHFDILRTKDGKVWELIKNIPAKGNSSTEQSYQITDRNGIGEVYYRLRSVDNDGKEEVFNPISTNCERTDVDWNAYPIPVNNRLTVDLFALSDQLTIIEVCDLEGRIILRKEVDVHSGINQFEIDVQNFANNVYFLRIQNNNEYLPIKFVKM